MAVLAPMLVDRRPLFWENAPSQTAKYRPQQEHRRESPEEVEGPAGHQYPPVSAERFHAPEAVQT